MRNFMVVAVAVFGMASLARAGDNRIGAEFSAPVDKVYPIALEVVQSKLRLERADKETAMIFFSAGGGARVSLLFSDSEGKTKVTSNATKTFSLPSADQPAWKVAQKSLRLIGERLHKDGLIPESEIPKK